MAGSSLALDISTVMKKWNITCAKVHAAVYVVPTKGMIGVGTMTLLAHARRATTMIAVVIVAFTVTDLISMVTQVIRNRWIVIKGKRR